MYWEILAKAVGFNEFVVDILYNTSHAPREAVKYPSQDRIPRTLNEKNNLLITEGEY